METFSNVLLVAALLGVTVLAGLYLLLQPWWRSWFGISFVLMLVALVQAAFRGLLVLVFGDDYAGSEWVTLLGRLEFAVGAWISVVGLGRALVRSYRATGRPYARPGDPLTRTRVS